MTVATSGWQLSFVRRFGPQRCARDREAGRESRARNLFIIPEVVLAKEAVIDAIQRTPRWSVRGLKCNFNFARDLKGFWTFRCTRKHFKCVRSPRK